MSNKSLGFVSILSLALGTMVGVGILIAPSLLYKFGRFGYFAWPVASFLCLGLALMFSKLSQIASSSSPAGFVQDAFGHMAGFQTGWCHWVGLTAAQSVISYSFGQYVAPYINLGFDTSLFLSIGVIWLITIVSCSMRIFSVSMTAIITSLKLIVLTLVILLGLSYLNIPLITSLPAQTDGGSAFLASMSMCLLSFIGLEVATISNGNVHNPQFTIPAATIVATVIASVLYTLSYAVVGSTLTQHELAHTATPMVDVAVYLMGPIGGLILTVLAGCGFFASVNGILYGQSYILKHLSDIGVFSRKFSYQTKAGFPLYSALLSASCATLLIILLNTDKSYLPIIGSMSACFVSIVYLWCVMAYRYLSGKALLWLISFFTSLAFLFGSVMDCKELIPVAFLTYVTGFFMYGICTTKSKNYSKCEDQHHIHQ